MHYQKKASIVEKLAGKYRNLIKNVQDIKTVKEESFKEVIKEKYSINFDSDVNKC